MFGLAKKYIKLSQPMEWNSSRFYEMKQIRILLAMQTEIQKTKTKQRSELKKKKKHQSTQHIGGHVSQFGCDSF